MGVPQDDRHLVFDWSNRMIGSDDPEYQLSPDEPAQASMELLRLRRRAVRQEAARSPRRPHQRAHPGRRRRRPALRARARPVLPAAGRGRQRDHPQPHLRGHGRLLRPSRSVGATAGRPFAPALGRRGDAPLRHPGHALPPLGRQSTRWSATRRSPRTTRSSSSTSRPTATNPSSPIPNTFDIERTPNHHMAFGGGGPHFCLGANLARMEIRVMFEHLLDRVPDIRLDGQVQRLRSNFINGVKHIPVAFTPWRRSGAEPTGPSRRRPSRKRTPMRFHQAVTFLPVDEMVALSAACDTMGYAGVYFSDHLFNPRDLKSRYTYSDAPDGAPFWEKQTEWPDPMCLISALGRGDQQSDVHHRHLHRAGPGPDHRGQVGRHRRGAVPRPGQAGGGSRVVRGGVRPDRAGLPHPRQAAERHDPRPSGAVAGRLGRVPRDPLRRAPVPDEPLAEAAHPHPRRRGLRRRPASGLHPVRRVDQHRGRATRRGLRRGRKDQGRAGRPDGTTSRSRSTWP